MKPDHNAICPACGAKGLMEFHTQNQIPTNSCLLLDDYAEAAGFSRGDLRLGLCDQCGFVTNMDFEFKAEYSARYEERQRQQRSLLRPLLNDRRRVGWQ